MYKKAVIIFAMLAVLPVLPSCFDEPVKPIKEAPTDTWPDMTNEDDVIEALVWCYDNPSSGDAMTRYEGLLHSEYFFRLAASDVAEGENPIFTRVEDIAVTGAIFEKQTQLFLNIMELGDWYDCPEVEETPCTGCRETTRQYYIRVQFGRDAKVYQSLPDRASVTIVVAPDESDSSKWVIRAIYDLDN